MPWPKIFELIIGTSVSDTSAEKPIAAAMVIPNSPNSRPMLPGMNEIGRENAYNNSAGETESADRPADVAGDERDRQEHCYQHQRGRDDGEADLATAVDGREQRR